MSAPTTDNDYNAASRDIQVKLEVYLETPPLVVTTGNYLISASLLEEAQAESQTILGQVSSNELSFDLYNDTKIFTPTNPDSPYYGKITKGIKVVAYGRAYTGDQEWDALGTYYVKEWSTMASGLVASVTAYDKLYDVFDAPLPLYYVTKDVVIKDFYTEYFNRLHITANIDNSLTYTLQYAYMLGNNKDFLNDLSNGALAMCHGNRQDGVNVISRLGARSLRATLTDSDQIINITTTQSIDTGYDGVSVTCNSKQESSDTSLLNIKDQALESGNTALNNLSILNTPMVRLNHVSVVGNGTVHAQSVTATPDKVNLNMVNEESTSQLVDITVNGTYLQTVSSVEADEGSNLLKLDSDYLQTQEQCSSAIEYLQKAISIATPMLTVETRGNFKLLLGDKIRVNSSKFKTDFTGIIIRSKCSYDGGLRCTLTLMDARIFGEVI